MFTKQLLNKEYLDELFNEKLTKRSLNFDLFILFLIFVSSMIYVLETAATNFYLKGFLIFVDSGILFLFTIELIIRFWLAKDKKDFFLSSYTWIDLLAIIPFWFGLAGFQFFRVFRFFRIFRFFRFLKYSRDYFDDLEDWTLEKLFMFRILFTIILFIIVAAALVFEVEAAVNPYITTFWDAFYFVLISVTTVGYGDIVPVTDIAKIIIMFTILGGIIVVPIHITSLIKYLAEEKNIKRITCLKCGLNMHAKGANYCLNCGYKIKR